jgi:hypothetical protein
MVEQKQVNKISVITPKKDDHVIYNMLASMLCSICRRKIGYDVEVVVQHPDFGYCHKSCYLERVPEVPEDC